MTVELTKEELDAIINVLGQLPTSSGAWPLLMKLKMQAEKPKVEEP